MDLRHCRDQQTSHWFREQRYGKSQSLKTKPMVCGLDSPIFPPIETNIFSSFHPRFPGPGPNPLQCGAPEL